MSDFTTAVLATLAWEGGYVWNPVDPGGSTNFGIAQADHPGIDIRDLTKEQAIAIYQAEYWNPLYSQIADQGVANKLFDLGVNEGTKTAVLMLQRALAYIETGPIVTDGVFGAQTLAATNAADPQKLLAEIRARAVANYCQICASNPSQVGFALGWGRRLMG
jgi:lysozyme family protein